jgi:hypothetical protein
MSLRFSLKALPAILVSLFCISSSLAQRPQERITTAITASSRVTLAGSHPPVARAENDAGMLPVSTPLNGVSIAFSRSAAQEADLQALLVAQQDPSSSQYHQWLTPDQFAARFGMADSDIAKVQAWLTQQGFTVNAVSRSRNRITFSGTAAQVNAAFGTELHNFTAGSETHFAPATDLTLPAALSGVVQAVDNLTSFRPRPHIKVKPAFTSSQTGTHFLTPKDVATIYDINAAYTKGYTGTGQSIALVGQSQIATGDITRFQTAAGLTAKLPTLVLMPNTGTSVVSSGDESESDLDVEYSGAIATGASIFLVYTGSNPTYGAFDALTYAVDERIAPIISSSYGDCETDLGATGYTSYNAALAQAAAQGQTVIAAAGDDGSTDCYQDTDLSATQRTALAADFPASSQYVTGMGGTEFPAADVAVGNTTYFSAAPSTTTDSISSALSYIPEMVWNDDSASGGISSGGGGTSIYTPRPTWQAGVSGIAAGTQRLVPDLALDSSPNNAGYLYCSSDTSDTGITGSCFNGFRDASNVYLTVAGGTSFAAPIFAGMLAIINQSRNSTGQGLINPTLYTLAANSTTYASAFHDITSGGNQCTAGTSYCTTIGEAAYAATTGYDEASGLGSVDMYNLLTAWPAATGTAALQSTVTTVTAATAYPAVSASDTITITVAPGSSLLTSSPTGTLTLLLDGTAVSNPPTLSGGTATYTFSSAVGGSHIIAVTYSGDSTYASSTGSIELNVGGTPPSTGTYTIAATNVSVTAGATGVSTVTVTPASGYTGTIAWTVTSTASLTNTCYAISNVNVTGATAVTTSLTLYTSEANCSSTLSRPGSGNVRPITTHVAAASPNPANRLPFGAIPAGVTLAGLALFGSFGFKRRKRLGWSALALCMIGILGLGISGCSSSGSAGTTTTTTSTVAPKGTYTLTLTGVDTSTSAITATTTLTLTVN